jgi:hypothetical protein
MNTCSACVDSSSGSPDQMTTSPCAPCRKTPYPKSPKISAGARVMLAKA